MQMLRAKNRALLEALILWLIVGWTQEVVGRTWWAGPWE